jgi:signal recognition particle receptor subunit beta
LKGADGVVFVADSMRVRHEQNIESLKDLAQNLKDYGINIFKFPLVMQYNKRDLADAGVPLMSIEEMNQLYNRQLKAPHFPGSATTGLGVNDTFKSALIHTLRSIKKQAGWE